MYKICIFAGTSEGRELVEFLSSQPVSVTACVATEYGEALLEPRENLTISAGRLTQADMEVRFSDEKFDLVIDATHPYASVVTENLICACQKSGTEYLRLLRGEETVPEGSIFVENMAQAAEFLNHTEGNILLTTGSKELSAFSEIENFSERVYARVLPMENSLSLCREAGLVPAHILAMQGPFSQEMNVAMLRAVSAKYMVTKESGAKGGFDQKIAAARAADARLVVVGRPLRQEGLSFEEIMQFLSRRFGFSRHPQVTIAGIGPGSRDTMTGEVLDAVYSADCLLGAHRMLEAVSLPGKAAYAAILPDDIAAFIRSHSEYQKFTVLMSGDTGFYSGAKKLLPLLTDCSVTVLPGLSSLAYLCAKLQTSYEDVVPVSLHGREHNICGELRRHHRIFVLVGGENGMGRLCRRLTEAGMGDVLVSAGQDLSYDSEKITVGTAAELSGHYFETLSAALLESRAADAVVTHGLPDDVFQRKSGPEGVVPMTKSEVRAVCLSKLRLTENSVCWDVGSGTGSVAIEMALQAGGGHVYAVEKKEEAMELLLENCRKLHVQNVTPVSGTAPAACTDLEAPSHVFIGGSSGNMKEIISLILSKNPHARIVATAIALETVAELTRCMEEFPFTEKETVLLSVSKSRQAGACHLMLGQNPIYIFTMQAGGENG